MRIKQLPAGICEDLRLSKVIKFDRGDRVKVATDFRPRPSYVVLARRVEEDGEWLMLAQCGTGFQRTVPLAEIKPEIAE